MAHEKNEKNVNFAIKNLNCIKTYIYYLLTIKPLDYEHCM